LADTPHAYPLEMDAEKVARLRGVIEGLGLKISNVNANCSFGYWKPCPPEPLFEPSLISDDESLRSARVRLIERAIGMAGGLSADTVSITTGKPLGGMAPRRAWGELKRGLTPLLQLAHEKGVRIGIEQEPGLLVEWVDELAQLIDEIGAPNLGA